MPTRTWATAPAAVAAAIESATYVVAASDSQDPTRADAAYRCDGVADEVEINAAIAALPAGVGGTVFLLEGTYTLAGSIVILRDNVTLMGSGSGTVIQGAIAVSYIEVGDGATALTGIVIRNLRIDGTSQTAGYGIYFHGGVGTLITYSWVTECYIHDVDSHGIRLEYTEHTAVENNICQGNGSNGTSLSASNNNTITGNTCQGNDTHGIGLLSASNNNTITGNTCQGNTENGIHISTSDNNTVTGNTCNDNGNHGIYVLGSDNNTVTGNTCNDNGNHGIYVLGSDNNTVTGNTCIGRFHGIRLGSSNYNTVTGNTCNDNIRHGIYLYTAHDNTITGNTCIRNDVNNTGLYDGINIDVNSDKNLVIGNVCNENDRYGINIVADTCNDNWVENNELIGNTAGPFNDVGTDTKLATKIFQFQHGGDGTDIVTASFVHADASAKGWTVDAAGEWAIALGHLPLEVQQVVRVKVWAVGLDTPGVGNQMLLELLLNGAASDEPFNTNSASVVNKESEETNFAANDVIHWVFTSTDHADIGNLLGGDSIEVKVKYNAAVAPDMATNAVFRCVEIEYV